MRAGKKIQAAIKGISGLAFGMLIVSTKLYAQSFDTAKSFYKRAETFNPVFYPLANTEIRAADGRPGPKYWQNSADYSIIVKLDTIKDLISGAVIITYTNNSPQSLDFLWLQLDQNVKKKNSRYLLASIISSAPVIESDLTDGLVSTDVFLTQKEKKQKADYIIDDSRMQLRLQRPLASNGGQVSIHIYYHFTIPEQGAGRMGITSSQRGKIYQIAQWYPRMAVYDDIEGWNTIPYQIGSEFYLPYGNFHYTINAPANMLIAGSGNLLNGKEVLTVLEQKNLERAGRSDRTIIINDLSAPIAHKGTKTWKFSCMRSRDIAWAASAAFIWDAARINLPGNKKALAMSVYPVEAATAEGWKQSTEFTKAAVEIFSKKWYPYPYANAINVAGNVSGMEYPGIVFTEKGLTGGSLWEITAHEFGHTWFPMIVGSNERKYAWMDEGFNTFITDLATREFKGGKFVFPGSDSLAAFQIKRLFAPEILPIMSTPMLSGFTENYWKPAVALKLLRNEILGAERFDYAFQSYIKNWAFRHPVPWDFFHAMENAAGEDLSWFWRGWIINNWKLDQSVRSFKYVDENDLSKGVKITIVNNDKMVMPVSIKITEENNESKLVKLPVEIWQKGSEWTFWYASTTAIKEIQIDPGNRLPDTNRKNNVWKRSP